MLPLFKVFMAPDAIDRVRAVLESGYVGEGEVSRLLEEGLGELIGNPNVAVVNSGTAAITLALRLAGARPGSSVVTSPMTCLATNMPILSLGARPIWADILPDGTIDPVDVARKVDRKTAAVLCMDWGGLPCHLDRLSETCRTLGIPLIEDACQALGSTFRGEPVGSQADFVCFSFQAIKVLSTVDGGALVVNSERADLDRARLLRWFGLDRTKSPQLRCGQNPPDWGYKFQTNDVLAAIGLANLPHVLGLVKSAREHAARYNTAFAGLRNVHPVAGDAIRQSNCWLYTLLVDDVGEFCRFMARHGIAAAKVHDRNDVKTVFALSRDFHLPGVDRFDSHHVCIPVGWWLAPEDVERVVAAVCDFDRAFD